MSNAPLRALLAAGAVSARWTTIGFTLALATAVLSSCSGDGGGATSSGADLPDAAAPPDAGPACVDPTDGPPDDVFCTGLYENHDSTQHARTAAPYTPGLTFRSDGAQKDRYLYLSPGTKIDTSNLDARKFPVGTVVDDAGIQKLADWIDALPKSSRISGRVVAPSMVGHAASVRLSSTRGVAPFRARREADMPFSEAGERQVVTESAKIDGADEEPPSSGRSRVGGAGSLRESTDGALVFDDQSASVAPSTLRACRASATMAPKCSSSARRGLRARLPVRLPLRPPPRADARDRREALGPWVSER